MPANRKCPPGVICIENLTMYFLIFVILFLIYLIFFHKNHITTPQIIPPISFVNPMQMQHDVLLNPYAPPLKDDRYFIPVPPRVPINISTNVGAVDTNYRQIGILTPFNRNIPNDKILPLLGRPLFTNRDKWQYYTMSDQNNSVKLPVKRNGRNCMNEYGCDSLSNGDIVFVEGYKQRFQVTMYENDTIKYLPFI